jgi:hypothetical protein
VSVLTSRHRRAGAPHRIPRSANGRCDQENVIEQLKNAVKAMRMPAPPRRSGDRHSEDRLLLGLGVGRATYLSPVTRVKRWRSATPDQVSNVRGWHRPLL